MRIVIFHYHLNPGGVTRIVQSQIRSLQLTDSLDIAILTGYCPNPESYKALGVSIFENSLFNYLTERNLPKTELDKRYATMLDYLKTNFSNQDILHLHNVNLGKNPLMTLLTEELSSEGWKIVNHCHDFAEDRPENLQFLKNIAENVFQKNLNDIMYPQRHNHLYCTLNIFDLNRIGQRDINCNQKFLLPNPIDLNINSSPDRRKTKETISKIFNLDNHKRIVTYPVRVIKRKNIGEFILLSVIFDEQAHWLVTLPPQNPIEIERYEVWLRFCREHNLPIIFEAGTKAAFTDIIAASDFCITTSIREGFGMVFMEPWLMETPVVGRNIPCVTVDLLGRGMQFPILYDQLIVNSDGELIDFKDLTPEQQRNIIENTLKSNVSRNEILALNPELEKLLIPVDQEIINQNKFIINNKYSLQKFGESLYGVYKKFTGRIE